MKKTQVIQINETVLHDFSMLVKHLKNHRENIEKFKKQMESHKYASIGIKIIPNNVSQRIYLSCYFSDSFTDFENQNHNIGFEYLTSKLENINKSEDYNFIVNVSDLPSIELSKTDLIKIESINTDKLEDLDLNDSYSILKALSCFALNRNFEISDFKALQDSYLIKKIEDENLFVLIDKSNNTPVSIMEADKDDFGEYYRVQKVHFSSDVKRDEFNELASKAIQCEKEYTSEDFVALFKLKDIF
jgi:hypothetical protein